MDEFVFNMGDLDLKESSLEKVLSNNSFKEETINPEEEDVNVSKTTQNSKDNSDEPAEEEGFPKASDTENKTETPSSKSSEPSETNNDDDGDDDENTSSIFSALATVLKEEGVLSVDDESLKGIKDIKDLINSLKSNKTPDLSESQKRYLEALEVGVPLNEYEKMEVEIENLKSINDDSLEKDIQLRFELIAYDFMDKGIPKEKAVELANRSIKLKSDFADARESLTNLINSKEDKYKSFIESKKQENIVNLEKLKEKINSTENILKDIKLSEKQREKIYDLMTVKVDIDKNTGKPINEFNKWYNDNKEDAELILNTLYYYTNKFKDLSKISSKVESKNLKDLESRLKEIDASDLSLNLNKGSTGLKNFKFDF